MSKWAVRTGHFLLIGMLFVSLGGHLALFQTIAWASMLKDFSKTATLSEAAEKTFGGEHPCPLCKAVTESKKQEEKKTRLKAESKMEVALPALVQLKPPLGVSVVIPVPAYHGQASEIMLVAPLRPPRRA